jgi:His-Xaa-Ser system protein HxsD
MIPVGLVRAPEVQPAFWRRDNAHVALALDPTIYAVDAVLRAAYKFSDKASWLLDRQNDQIFVFVIGKKADADVEPIVSEFMNELLDQQLRVRLEQQFGTIRDLIVAEAFSEGNLLDADRDNGDYRTDPRGAGRGR